MKLTNNLLSILVAAYHNDGVLAGATNRTRISLRSKGLTEKVAAYQGKTTLTKEAITLLIDLGEV